MVMLQPCTAEHELCFIPCWEWHYLAFLNNTNFLLKSTVGNFTSRQEEGFGCPPFGFPFLACIHLLVTPKLPSADVATFNVTNDVCDTVFATNVYCFVHGRSVEGHKGGCTAGA